jgi:PAS domain S-box-containing protein
MNSPLPNDFLLNADNCYYLLLDSQQRLIESNEEFKKIVESCKTAFSHQFSNLLPEPQKTNFHTLLDTMLTDNVSRNSFTSILSTTQQYTKTIHWNISVIKDNDQVIGYEMLGVPGKEARTLQKHDRRLKALLKNLKRILSSSLDMICAFDEAGAFTNVSAASKNILGYQPRELIGKHYFDFVHQDDVEKTKLVIGKLIEGEGTYNFENRLYRKDGSVVYLNWSSKWEAAERRFYCIGRDATEKKLKEEQLEASEEKYKLLFQEHPIPTWIYDVETLRFLEVNQAAEKHYGYTQEEFLQMHLKDILHEKERERFDTEKKDNTMYSQRHRGIWQHRKKNKEIFFAEITSNSIFFHGHEAKLVLSIDRTEQIRAQQELIKSNEKYLFLSEATFDAIWDWDIVTNRVQWNEGVKDMFGVTDENIITFVTWWSESIHPEDQERVLDKLHNHIENCISNWEDEYRFKNADGSYKYIYDRGYMVYNDYNKPLRMIGAMEDLTERKNNELTLQKLNNSLEKRAKELAASNEELERFAYVASHDLQEPLRMVTSFLQLLEKRYKDKLDAKALEYIAYAVDGAERMKKLILDLLEYSRVNTSLVGKENVDIEEILQQLRITYKRTLAETEGVIVSDKMPVVKGSKTQILQLFQNLIGNAFKYKSERAPVIKVLVTEEASFYRFAIEDNGIGIDPKFFNKIFIIFQRLHNRENYSGTGIGLAICKKIIDKYGGKIWVTSKPGEGSTFYFTLPK